MPSVKTRVALLDQTYRTAGGVDDALLIEGSTVYQPNSTTLTALSTFNTVGLLTQTSTAPAFTGRTITASTLGGIAVTAGNGSTANPTIAPADDLLSLESATSTNAIYYRSASSSWSPVTVGAGLDFTGGTLKGKTLVTTTTSTNYTAVLADAFSVIQFSTLATFTIPSSASVAFDTGTWIEIHQGGAGAVTPTPVSTSVTLNVRAGAGTGTAGQYAVAAIRKTAADTWILTGDLV